MPRTGVAALIFIALGLLLVFLVVQANHFWSSHDSLSWQECAFGDAPCSTAAATWLLAVIGFLAFVAALATVDFSGRMFGLETNLTLGQSPCSHLSDDHPPDKILFVTAGAQLLERYPVGITEENLRSLYSPLDVAFENLGRTALGAVSVTMHVEGLDGTFVQNFPCDIGNIKRDGEKHISLYIDNDLSPVRVTWCDATERGKRIGFLAENPVEQSVDIPTLLHGGALDADPPVQQTASPEDDDQPSPPAPT